MANMTRQQFVDALRAKAAGRYIDLSGMQATLPSYVSRNQLGSMFIAATHKRQVSAKWFSRWTNSASHYLRIIDLGRGTPKRPEDIGFTCNSGTADGESSSFECDAEFCNWAISKLWWTNVAPAYMSKREVYDELNAMATGRVIDVGAVRPGTEDFTWKPWGTGIWYGGTTFLKALHLENPVDAYPQLSKMNIGIRVHNLSVRNPPDSKDIELFGGGWGHNTEYDEALVLEAIHKLPFVASPSVCEEGDRVITKKCADGSLNIWRDCINGVWISRQQDCHEGCEEGQSRPITKCPDGAWKRWEKCVDGIWVEQVARDCNKSGCPQYNAIHGEIFCKGWDAYRCNDGKHILVELGSVEYCNYPGDPNIPPPPPPDPHIPPEPEPELEEDKDLLYPIFDFMENVLGVDRKTAEMATYFGIVGLIIVALGAMLGKK